MAENCKDSRPLLVRDWDVLMSYLSHKQLKSLPFSPLSHVRSDLAIHLDKVTPRYGKRIVTTVHAIPISNFFFFFFTYCWGWRLLV